MKEDRTNVETADFILIGSGIAGLRAALELAGHGSVVMLTKDKVEDSSSEAAQGGVAVALSDEDRVGFHLQDTLQAGDGLCDEDMVRVLVEEGLSYVTELIAWGTKFDRDGIKLSFTREGAHSKRRILHAQGDSTGHEIVRTLSYLAKKQKRIRVIPRAFTVDLLLDADRCTGVSYLSGRNEKARRLEGKAVLMATGGAGHIYPNTTNPPQATGDGMAIAFRAGAEMMDMEFVQFHPTALSIPGVPTFLISESLRGEGGFLRNTRGDRFMDRYHEQKELAPRDVVSRAILKEIKRTGDQQIYLDLTHLEPDFVRRRFPMIHKTCLSYGVDITSERIPVTPSAHYMMGGIATDAHGRTSIPGLYAAGEVACTGVHGANRLASNSLLEGLVFGGRSAKAMLADVRNDSDNSAGRLSPTAPSPSTAAGADSGCGLPCPNPSGSQMADLFARICLEARETMWQKVGITRCGTSLGLAEETLRAILETRGFDPCCRAGLETLNILTVCCLTTRAALLRTESRGSHYRTDHPHRDDQKWDRHSSLTKDAFKGFRLFC